MLMQFASQGLRKGCFATVGRAKSGYVEQRLALMHVVWLWGMKMSKLRLAPRGLRLSIAAGAARLRLSMAAGAARLRLSMAAGAASGGWQAKLMGVRGNDYWA